MGLWNALTSAHETEKPKCRVVIVGAGPAGLLTAINFLRREGPVQYTVDLVETGEDFGALDAAGLEKKRSWMIGLSAHGLAALRRVPGLHEDFVGQVGVQINKVSIFLGARRIDTGSTKAGEAIKAGEVGENYVVDRNYIVAAIARYLNTHYLSSGRLTLHYSHKMMFVDPDARRIFVRRGDGAERYLPYDLLVGADGIRSAVRSGLVANHRDFECSVSDIFNKFKSVHVNLPAALAASTLAVFPQCVPGMNGIGLPETGGKINISMGHQLHKPCDEALLSTDAAVVAAYLRATFKACELPWDEFAQQWVGQDWNQTGQVHCNSYHSSKLRLLIMGDAAHATSPSIGMGMNTALADAAALDELLEAHADDLDDVLPAYSEARVKEGNALTDIAFNAYSFSPAQQLRMTLASLVRGFFSKHLGPSLVAPEPINEIANGAKLSDMYAELTRIGWLPAVRAVNDAARRRHFELRTGMVKARPSRLPAVLGAACALAGLAVGITALAATQAVSKPLMEPAGGTPLLEVCGDPAKFAASGLHAYEPALGGSFVCLITQFLHALALEPAGLLSWGLTIGLSLPVTVLWNAEAGRAGASGLVRWVALLGCLGQLLGISVVFPALWLPAAWYGKGDGAVSPARAYASVALAAPFVSLTVALFALDPASRAWTVCAGLLGGPAVALLPILLSLIPAPAVAMPFDEFPSAGTLVAKQTAAGAKALGHAYALAGVLAFVGYVANLYLASLSYASLGAARAALWAEATPAVAFMAIDTGALFLGLLLFLASTAPAEAGAALAASPLLGPGAACALLLHRREMRQHAEASVEAQAIAVTAGKKKL